jgi:hypothetical protein
MKDRKTRKDVSIREHLDDLIDNELDLKLHELAYIFCGTKDYANDFQQLYVQPLLDSGLTLDEALAMLLQSVLLPN